MKAETDKVQIAGLAEAFRLLNDTRHREARMIIYEFEKPNWAPSEASFNIIGIQPLTSKDQSNQKELVRICKEIVKNDLNEIGVLAYHGYLDEEKFIEEGFWVILRAWDILQEDIMKRRKTDSDHHMEHLQDLRKKACKYARKKDPEVYERFCPDMGPITNESAGDFSAAKSTITFIERR